MSMNGIMLISANVVCVLPSRVVIAMCRHWFECGVLVCERQQFRLQVIQLIANVSNLIHKVVVRHDSRNCGEQAEGGRNQCVRDARGHSAERRCTCISESGE